MLNCEQSVLVFSSDLVCGVHHETREMRKALPSSARGHFRVDKLRKKRLLLVHPYS